MKTRNEYPTEIEVGGEQRQVIICFNFWPEERATREDPGSPPEIEIVSVLDQDSAEDYLPVLTHKDTFRIEKKLWEVRNDQ